MLKVSVSPLCMGLKYLFCSSSESNFNGSILVKSDDFKIENGVLIIIGMKLGEVYAAASTKTIGTFCVPPLIPKTVSPVILKNIKK